jgi:hypothetical protein
MRQFLAPYAATLKQLSAKAGGLQGYPLKSAVRIAFGGEHCNSAKGQQQSSASGASGGGQPMTSLPPTNVSSAASALGAKLMGGLFKKKSDSASSTSTASGPSGTLPLGMVQAAQFTIETQSITTGPIPPTQFDIPAGWKLVPPPAPKAAKEFSCSASAGS